MTNYKLRKLICIECPKGCGIACRIRNRRNSASGATGAVSYTNGRVVKLSGNKCVKGKAYAKREIENPMRILTTTVRATGFELAVLPIRTDRQIPKSKIFDAMKVIKKIRISKPVPIGSVIAKNISGTGANLITTREIKKQNIEYKSQKHRNTSHKH